MKAIRKDLIIELNYMKNIEMEKNVLLRVDHPFLVNMEYVFQTEFRVYFLMKFVKGGELFRHLQEVRRFPEDTARFFMVQVALALGHLHSQDIIYRDLKPENVLVGEDGKYSPSFCLTYPFHLSRLFTSCRLWSSEIGKR